jgi:hypothetical protein
VRMDYKRKVAEGHPKMSVLNANYSHEYHDSDWPDDQQLPFKTVVLFDIGFAVVPLIAKADFAVKFNALRNVIMNDVHTLQKHFHTIFHPPRISF